MAWACCCLVECRCFRFSNHFIYLEFLYWIDAGIAAAQHSLWLCIDCYCHSQLNTMYGSYLKFLKTHKKTKKKEKKWTRNSNKLFCLQHAQWVITTSIYHFECEARCLYIYDCESLCVFVFQHEGRLIKIKLITYYKSDYFAFNHEIVVSVAQAQVR